MDDGIVTLGIGGREHLPERPSSARTNALDLATLQPQLLRLRKTIDCILPGPMLCFPWQRERD